MREMSTRAFVWQASVPNPTSPFGREWFSSLIFPSSNPLLPLRGGVYPSPYPLPWTWRGPVAGRWSAQDGPRWLQEGLRALKMASKIAQDSPTWLQLAHNMRPRGSSTAPRRLQVVKEPPKEVLERPKSFKHIGKPKFVLPPRLFASDGPLRPQDGPKMAQYGPKRGPRRPQERPRAPQERPKRAPRDDFSGPEGRSK